MHETTEDTISAEDVRRNHFAAYIATEILHESDHECVMVWLDSDPTWGSRTEPLTRPFKIAPTALARRQPSFTVVAFPLRNYYTDAAGRRRGYDCPAWTFDGGTIDAMVTAHDAWFNRHPDAPSYGFAWYGE